MRKDKRNHTIQILSASLLSSSMVVSMLPASVLAKEDDQQGSNRGLIEGEAPNYNISLGVAKTMHQYQQHMLNDIYQHCLGGF